MSVNFKLQDTIFRFTSIAEFERCYSCENPATPTLQTLACNNFLRIILMIQLLFLDPLWGRHTCLCADQALERKSVTQLRLQSENVKMQN